MAGAAAVVPDPGLDPQHQPRVVRLAGRLAAGRSTPRKYRPRRPLEKRPRRPNKLPTEFAWLRKPAPEARIAAAGSVAQLFDPAMAAPLRRPLRSLCRMLGIVPPPVPAPPRRPWRKPKPPAPERKIPPDPARPKRPSRVRYVGGLRYPSPFPNPA